MKLNELTDKQIDYVIGMGTEKRVEYLGTVLQHNFPNIAVGSVRYVEVLESYISSFFVEKLYRSNRFFNEKFIVTYTSKGLIRDIVADIYFNKDSLKVH